MTKKVAIIGGGIAGMEAASVLSRMDIEVLLIEKRQQLGGHVGEWDHLFPNFRPASEITRSLLNALQNNNIKICANTVVTGIARKAGLFEVKTNQNQNFKVDGILLATGFDLFDAHKKEEYGYGIYENVITSADLEKKLKGGNVLTTASGCVPKRIAMIHCVGSRDEKAGYFHCSRVCCITAVKQAIEIRQKLPNVEIFCFYMDLRMYGKGFEEIYREAQEKWGIQFVRGRLSEAGENIDGGLQIKSEDTLSGRPLKMIVDMIVLMVGMVPAESTSQMAKMLGIHLSGDGFIAHDDVHFGSNITNVPGIFTAGTITSPMTISDTIADARSAALKICEYIA
ncbi:MAG: CoB--CoM heterodisulfide reductase iron-sulfur subunit A family protein [Bacteroidales bacterium]|nr:CoB--CoM heterodisulfide reductase iron-sulfur subunit A family protein [Bacteroidales bacterium]